MHADAQTLAQSLPTLFSLRGDVVVITGASSGLGLRFAHVAAAAGASVVLGARRFDRLLTAAEQLHVHGGIVEIRETDVQDPDQCRALVSAAAERFGRVDVLVNNAGIANARPAAEESPDDFRRVVDVNLNAAFWMSQACADVMPPGSSIVNVASVHGLVASRFPQASYAASKAGLIGLTRDLAQQWSRARGIRVNALCPGYFHSELTSRGTMVLTAMVEQHSLLGRFGELHELDAALLFLASSASSYVTGTTLVVDGGLASI